MGKKNKLVIPSDSTLRAAWSSVALASGMIADLGAWSLTNRSGVAKLTGTDPGIDGTYLVGQGDKVTMFATLADLIGYFKGLR